MEIPPAFQERHESVGFREKITLHFGFKVPDFLLINLKASFMNNVTSKAHITSVATATPPYTIDQPKAAEFFEKNYTQSLSYRNGLIMRKVFAHTSIKQRTVTFDNPDILMEEDADGRISRFQYWSVELSARAARKALEKADLTSQDVKGIVVNTCTGYLCPGISTYLIEKLDLRRNTKAYDLVGSGCGGALPNLEIASAILGNNGDGAVLSVAVEICTATYQMGDNLSLIVSNAIFGDGAAVAVIQNKEEGMKLIDSANIYVPEQREAVRYVYKKGDLHNQISEQLPEILRTAVGSVVKDLLARHSLDIADIRHWAIHTGGDSIITAIQNELGLTEIQLKPTRDILYNYGNMSSPTVWFVIDEILKNGIQKGDWLMGVTFGAGLSVHAFLLKKR